MIIVPMSDLHLEFSNFVIPPIPNEKEVILVLAGDICLSHNVNAYMGFFENVSDRFKWVLYVAGNHEHYRSSVDKSLDDLEAFADSFPNITFGENKTVVLDGIKFFLATLWTDLNQGDIAAQFCAKDWMNDFRLIDGLTPARVMRMHHESRKLMWEAEPDVVITHHHPSYKGIRPAYRGQTLNHAYASDMEEFVVNLEPKLWVCGHTHYPTEYQLGETRVVCNTRGYHDECVHFNPTLRIEL